MAATVTNTEVVNAAIGGGPRPRGGNGFHQNGGGRNGDDGDRLRFSPARYRMGVWVGIGSIVSYYFQSLGWTLPAYIGAMIIGALFRNMDDKTNWFKIHQHTMDFAGGIALNIFLVVALMDLKLWELAHLAGPYGRRPVRA